MTHSVGYLDLDELRPEERMLRDTVHELAEGVVRPAARKLDRMSPEERVRPDSPYFEVMREIKRAGLHRIYLPPELGGLEISPLARYLVHEEMAWGSLGLATAMGVDMIPFVAVALLGGPEAQKDLLTPWVEDTEGRYHGCWAVTEPDHGSDYLIFLRSQDASAYGAGNVKARLDGSEWIVSGQKSAWVSSAPVATHAGLHVQLEGGENIRRGAFLVVPLDLPGVSRGRPVDMLGARDDPQGELFFDAVRVPEYYMIAQSPLYNIFSDQLLCLTSAGMGAFAVGVARAAFEEALRHARERFQGGVPIAQHKNIRLKLYQMFEKVETARYYVRKVMEHTHRRILEQRTFDASPRHARAAQVYAKKVAFEVAHSALEVFGAYGLNRDSLIEKIFRDARSLLIEDGTVDVLSLDAAEDLVANYEKSEYEAEPVTRGLE